MRDGSDAPIMDLGHLRISQQPLHRRVLGLEFSHIARGTEMHDAVALMALTETAVSDVHSPAATLEGWSSVLWINNQSYTATTEVGSSGRHQARQVRLVSR